MLLSYTIVDFYLLYDANVKCLILTWAFCLLFSISLNLFCFNWDVFGIEELINGQRQYNVIHLQ